MECFSVSNQSRSHSVIALDISLKIVEMKAAAKL
jgi:hypothetical protein